MYRPTTCFPRLNPNAVCSGWSEGGLVLKQSMRPSTQVSIRGIG